MLVPSDLLIEKIYNKMFANKEIENSRCKKCYNDHEVYVYWFSQLDIMDEVYVTVCLKSRKNIEKNTITQCTIYPLNVEIEQCLWQSSFFENIDFKNSIKHCMNDFYSKIQNLKLNKYTGDFHLIIDFIDEELPEEFKVGKECSVCLSKTITKLPCNHNLCVGCWSKMANLSTCDCANFNCPLCRLPAVTYHEESESDEDTVEEENEDEEGVDEGNELE